MKKRRMLSGLLAMVFMVSGISTLQGSMYGTHAQGSLAGDEVVIWENTATSKLPEASDGLSHKFVTVSDANHIFTRGIETTFVDAAKYTNQQGSFYLLYGDRAQVADLTPFLNDGLKLSFAIKLPSGRNNVQFRVMMGDSGWAGFADKTFTVTEGGKWQNVEIYFETMDVSNNFDASAFSFLWFQPVDGNTPLVNGDTCILADVKVSYGIENRKPVFDATIWENTATVRLPEPSLGLGRCFIPVNDPLIESSSAMETTFVEANRFLNRQAIFHIFNDSATAANLTPYVDKGLKLSFAIWLPPGRNNVQFNVLMGDSAWTGFASSIITVAQGGVWQVVEIPFDSMNVGSTFNLQEFSFVWLQPVDGNTPLVNGDTCILADLKVTYEKEISPAFILELLEYHPGVPGFDVVYEVKASYNNTILNRSAYSLKANLPGVTIDGNKIIVPDSVRQQAKTLSITATYLADKQQNFRLFIPLRRWILTLEDNFDTYNTDLWINFEEGITATDNPFKVNAANGAYVSNGKLILEVKKQNYLGYEITGAAVSTAAEFNQIFGLFTAKIKMPEKGGILSAFWLMPHGQYRYDGFFNRTGMSGGAWLCSEIDIVEHWATAGNVSLHTEHFWGDIVNGEPEYMGGRNYTYPIPNFVPGNFYEYTCVWTRNAIYYYVDGVLVGVSRDIETIDPVPAYMVLSAHPAPYRNIYNELFNGRLYNYNGWFGHMKDVYYPQTMEVDFVRVYR
jgi:hypothetical protein